MLASSGIMWRDIVLVLWASIRCWFVTVCLVRSRLLCRLAALRRVTVRRHRMTGGNNFEEYIPKTGVNPETVQPMIDLRGVRREFTQGQETVHALCATDLQVMPGEFVAIVGPSGSGKSTLMYLLGCLDSPTAGDFYLAGQEVGRLADAALSRARGRGIGYVFQQFFLLGELTVVENIALGLAYAGVDRATRQQRATELAEQMGLGHRLQHRRVQLSGGQIQRVAIARALATRPHLVLADEPTGALDTKTGQKSRKFSVNCIRGRTIVLITHDRSVAIKQTGDHFG